MEKVIDFMKEDEEEGEAYLDAHLIGIATPHGNWGLVGTRAPPFPFAQAHTNYSSPFLIPPPPPPPAQTTSNSSMLHHRRLTSSPPRGAQYGKEVLEGAVESRVRDCLAFPVREVGEESG
ncbi:unnamed protein product [Hydatigera taeniaeformis]|uniref:Uncharacterized protein n=1 Tax=Hydatigena taeniaeformis TaxID=6205 RepID=A0A0R3WR48_HYDTA|nr:unnamed protein product [Hydatigera taeniaeformis]